MLDGGPSIVISDGGPKKLTIEWGDPNHGASWRLNLRPTVRERAEEPEDGAKHQKPCLVGVVRQKENANQVDLGERGF